MNAANSWMTYKISDRSSEDWAVQSRGRSLTEVEQSFADALEATFEQGIHDMEDVAKNLNKLGVEAPAGGGADWNVEKLASELQTINASLDTAYEQDGYGA